MSTVADATVQDLTTRCYPATLPQDPTYPIIPTCGYTAPGKRLGNTGGDGEPTFSDRGMGKDICRSQGSGQGGKERPERGPVGQAGRSG